MKRVPILFLGFFLWACGGGQGSTDAGLDDGQSGLDGSGSDGGGSDGGDTVLFDGGITLRIPADFELCSMNGLWNSLQLPLFKFRASLLVGDHGLPLDQEQFELDLVGQVLCSPDGAEATALGPGQFRFWRQAAWDEFPEYCIFNYRQGFQAAAGTFEVSFGFYLECQAGTIWEMPANLGPGTYPCDRLDENTPGHVTATAGNGDQVTFDYFYYEGCAKTVGSGICPAFYGDPSRGLFQRGQEERETTDFYGLALSCIHHGLPATFLMVFDEALDGVHAVVLDDKVTPAELRYLDADLAVIATETVENISYDE